MNSNSNSSAIIKEAVNHMLEQDPEYNKLREQYIFSNNQSGGSSEYNAYVDSNVSNDVMNQLKQSSTESQEKSFNKVNKFARAMHKKYGSRDEMDFGTVMEHSRRHSNKIGLSDSEFRMYEVLYQQLVDKNNGDFPSNERNSQLGKTLGAVQAPFVSKTKSLKVANVDKPFVDEIIRIASLNRQSSAQCVLQSEAYTPHGMHDVLIQARFIPGLQNRSCAIHPLLLALFGPKIVSLDDRMLKTNLAGIIRDRLLGEPIRTRHDFELFIDLTTDQQESVCDSGSVFADILKRVKIQETLRRSIWQMRGGQLFECNTQGLISALEECQLSQTDSPHLMYIRDEGTMLRRLLSAFSFKPTHVTTRPVYAMTGLVPPIQKLDQLSMVNVVLPHGGLPTPSTVMPTDLMTGLSIPHWYLENGIVIPKQNQIVYSREVIFFYVNRRFQSIHSMFNSTYQFQRLPVATGGFDKLNTHKVRWDQVYQIHQTSYYLRSILCMRPEDWGRKYKEQKGGTGAALHENTKAENYGSVYNGCYTILVDPGNQWKDQTEVDKWNHGTVAKGSYQSLSHSDNVDSSAIWIYDPNLLILKGPTYGGALGQVFAAKQPYSTDTMDYLLKLGRLKKSWIEVMRVLLNGLGVHPADGSGDDNKLVLSDGTVTHLRDLVTGLINSYNDISTTHIPMQHELVEMLKTEGGDLKFAIDTDWLIPDGTGYKTREVGYVNHPEYTALETEIPGPGDFLDGSEEISALKDIFNKHANESNFYENFVHDAGPTQSAISKLAFAINHGRISKHRGSAGDMLKAGIEIIDAIKTLTDRIHGIITSMAGGSLTTTSDPASIDGLLRTTFGSDSNHRGQLDGSSAAELLANTNHLGMKWKDVVSHYGTIFVYSQAMKSISSINLDPMTRSQLNSSYVGLNKPEV